MTELPVNQKEYLKKYLAIGKAPGEKKKKKKKPSTVNRVQIIDDDADVNIPTVTIKDEVDEDAPQIVAVIDERPLWLRVDDKTNNPLWRPIGAANDVNPNEQKQMITGFKIASKPAEKFLQPDKSPPRKRKGASSNRSPPRKSRSDDTPPNEVVVKQERRSEPRFSDSSPPRRGEDGDVPPIRIKIEDDSSPPRRRKREGDNSPPRRNKEDSNRNKSQSSDDNSPPRRRKDDSDKSRSQTSDDNSPPRRRREDHERKKPQTYNSPPRRPRHEDDNSPPRRRRKYGNSYPRRSRWDNSPPQRHREVNKNRPKYKRDVRDISPPKRRKTPDNSPPRKHRGDDKEKADEKRSKKMDKTLDGKSAGLQNARELIEETQNFKNREDTMFKSLSTDVSGELAETVHRDRRTGKVRNLDEEEERKRKKQEEEEKNKEKYARWGRGLAQVENREQKLQEQLHEMSKPLARYADDEDLERYLKEQERDGDPMLAYIRKKRRKKAAEAGEVSKPQFEGEFMPNRYGIRPGHRWDGVDRSSGYEQKWFEVQNQKTALLEDSYKWSTEDM